LAYLAGFCQGQGQYVSGGTHGGYEFDDKDAGHGGVGKLDSIEREGGVAECATFRFGNLVDVVISEAVVDRAMLVEQGPYLLHLPGRWGVR